MNRNTVKGLMGVHGYLRARKVRFNHGGRVPLPCGKSLEFSHGYGMSSVTVYDAQGAAVKRICRFWQPTY